MGALTMSRFYLRISLIPIALFTLVLILIHAQPYDDHELRELLLPEGCPAPCFMGIRPGVTTVDEAIKILEVNKWIGKINNETSDNDIGFIYWNWSDQAPNWISKNGRGVIWATQKIVHSILIDTQFLLGDTRLVFGLPNYELIEPELMPSILYSAFYDQWGVAIQYWHSCHSAHPLLHYISIKFSVPLPADNFLHSDSLNDLLGIC
jgi:hypothetical protein